MRLSNTFTGSRTYLLTTLFIIVTSLTHVTGQQSSQNNRSGQDDDVLRIKTELVQTDLMVFDKQGRFVDDLRPEQFELSLDGKKQTISFFELVASGSASEAIKLAAARGLNLKSGEQGKADGRGATDKGRLIFFFLDDLHLSESSIMRARKALADFVENQMRESDQVAIVSASGQIGFLQQLTENTVVLHAAIDRLGYKRNTETIAGKTVITEYQANQMAEHGDRDLFNYIVSSTINEYQLVPPKGGDSGGLDRLAINMVRNRNRQILAQAKAATTNTLSVLESLMRSSAQLPGRKLVFFISDGFVADPRSGYAITMLQRITQAAARVGAVVYSMDARGTFLDPAVDAGRNDFPDGMASGTSARNPSLEASAMREPLRILADETGGRAILNSNSFTDAFQQAINETSTYYLLAWRPESEDERSGKARIRVTVKDRPDLRVRLRRNYYVPPPVASPEKRDERGALSAKAEQSPEAGLLVALGSLYPQRTIPTALSVGYLNTPDQGLILKAFMQIDRLALNLSAGEAQKTEIDVLGAAIDDRGAIIPFKQVLTVIPDPSAQNQRQPVLWSQQLKLKPGLYQVRVAVRERNSGHTGSAQQWVEVPDLATGRLQMSSLFLGERKAPASNENLVAAAVRSLTVDVDNHFTRTSVLRFQTYIYNAAHATASPDVEIQARIIRDNRIIVTMSPARLPTDTTKDLMRLPYWAEISLDQLPPGRYSLQVTATDRAAKTSVSQRAAFIVE